MTLALYDDIVIPDHIDPTVAYAYVLIFKAKLKEIDTAIENKLKEAYESDDFDLLGTLNNEVIDLRKLRKEVKIYHDFYESVNVLTGSPEWRRSFFPIRTHAQTEFYYSKIKDKNFQILSNVVIQGGEDKAVVVSDMVTGYLGVFRCNINTVFYNSADQDSTEVLVDKIFNGGVF